MLLLDDFNHQDIRVVTLEGSPWFVAMDVLDTLGYPAPSRTMILRKLDPTEITLKRIEGKSSRDLNLISESGLYKLPMCVASLALGGTRPITCTHQAAW